MSALPPSKHITGPLDTMADLKYLDLEMSLGILIVIGYRPPKTEQTANDEPSTLI